MRFDFRTTWRLLAVFLGIGLLVGGLEGCARQEPGFEAGHAITGKSAEESPEEIVSLDAVAVPTEGRPESELTLLPEQPANTESYAKIEENGFRSPFQNPLSTFSIDVDTASYANMRRFLSSGRLPPPDAVRIEEMINYFSYDYAPPIDRHPFAAHIEVARCPWNAEHQLARIAIKGRDLDRTKRPVSNLVFLIDVSGSMQDRNKLPLLKSALRLMVEELTENDRVAIVVYAGAAGLVLNSTTADHRVDILNALDRLQAGGSTNGGEGIELAYRIATENFIPSGTNRVVLCSDGDFNVGRVRHDELFRMIEEKARSGVFLSVLGFGEGNYKDSTMEGIADKGNGNYYYVDSINEARKVLVDELPGTLVTIAKDVKIQVEFNPARVGAYRLIGYENRMLAAQDFNDDQKDAGEIGAGHSVTALYELVPPSGIAKLSGVDPLKYQRPAVPVVQDEENVEVLDNGELLTLKLRYKLPEEDESQLIVMPFLDSDTGSEGGSESFRWAASVAAFGMILRDSEYRGNATLQGVEEMATASRGRDFDGYRAEFLELVQQAQRIPR